MKVRWQFFFEYEDLKFEKIYCYGVPVSIEQARAFGLPANEFEAILTVEANEEKHPDIKHLGKINILLPGDNEQTEEIAYALALSFAENVTFSQGRITIDGGFISNELLPETSDEAEKVGENRFSYRVQFKKMSDRIPFDSGSVQTVTNNPLIKQFNEANNAKSPIDRFIGLFKILEDLYGSHPVKSALKSSTELREIAMQHLVLREKEGARHTTETEFENLVDKLVVTRHECAHLRRETGFGISYGDARVQSQVEPLLVPLEILSYAAIQRELARMTVPGL
jgi:hypothetical protein